MQDFYQTALLLDDINPTTLIILVIALIIVPIITVIYLMFSGDEE